MKKKRNEELPQAVGKCVRHSPEQEKKKRRRSEGEEEAIDSSDLRSTGFPFDHNLYQHCAKFDQKCMRTLWRDKNNISVLNKYHLVVNEQTKHLLNSIREDLKHVPNFQKLMRTDYFKGRWVGLANLKEFYASPEMENIHKSIAYLLVNFTDMTLPEWKEPEVAGIENYMKLRERMQSERARKEHEGEAKSLKREKTLYPGNDLKAFYTIITEGLFKHRDKRQRKPPVKKARLIGYDGPALNLRSRGSGGRSAQLDSPNSESN
jgi:hypothetical protein